MRDAPPDVQVRIIRNKELRHHLRMKAQIQRTREQTAALQQVRRVMRASTAVLLLLETCTRDRIPVIVSLAPTRSSSNMQTAAAQRDQWCGIPLLFTQDWDILLETPREGLIYIRQEREGWVTVTRAPGDRKLYILRNWMLPQPVPRWPTRRVLRWRRRSRRRRRTRVLFITERKKKSAFMFG